LCPNKLNIRTVILITALFLLKEGRASSDLSSKHLSDKDFTGQGMLACGASLFSAYLDP